MGSTSKGQHKAKEKDPPEASPSKRKPDLEPSKSLHFASWSFPSQKMCGSLQVANLEDSCHSKLAIDRQILEGLAKVHMERDKDR